MASFSQEYQEHNQADGSGKVKVTILASEWGSSKGGLSTINRKLAIQLAKCSEVEITFFVPRCSEGDKKEALSHNINIVEAKKFIGFEDLELLSFPPDDLKSEVVIGHGAKVGRQAQVIRDRDKCKWVQVVHTDPEELGMFKSYPDPISKGQEKHYIEVRLCEEADFVVTIGPKLAESFRRYLQSCKNHETIFDFTPGIFEEFLSVDQGLEERKDCTVLVFGRGDAEDFQLKGFDIAGKAVASLAGTHLIFVGAPYGKYQEIKQSLLDCGLPATCLKVRGCVKCRESLRKLFCEVDLVVMPSRTDGFGLTGLEALSAGLPVLVSKNSGFGECLSKVPFGSSFVIDSEKPEVWAAAIKNIWDKDRQNRLEEVQILRLSYERKYSWTKQSDALLVKIINLVRARLRLQIGCEVITGANAQTGTGTLVTPQQPQEVIQGVGGVPSSSNEQHAVVTPSLAAESELYGGIPFTETDTQRVLNTIALRTFQGLNPSTPEERNEFVLYLERVHKAVVVDVKSGSLVITVEVM
ncbi:D-inositol 3-phosphate glycosyltransferase-like [Montipora capricornis]|uniref:D-inositol 3-phosphate glycosyltransferase-like n=1 Tax=Montipora capricornis TaxID=246305 RepID=UPI0035F15E0E